MLNRKLLSLLISLLLTLSPFASLEVAAAAVAGDGHCMMTDMQDGNAVGSVPNVRSADSQAMPDCTHCKNDNNCNDDNCANYGCSAGHALFLIQAAGLPVHDHRAVRHLADVSTSLLSRSSPPLLRPPV